MTVNSIAKAFVVICITLSVAGFGGLSLAKASSNNIDELVKQVNVLHEQLQLLVGTSAAGILTNGGCINNNISYQNNSVIQKLILNNRIPSSLKGYQYRCTNGRWVMEKTPVTNASSTVAAGANSTGVYQSGSSSSTAKSCISGGNSYPEGTSRTSITVDGKTTSISDARFVCRSGVWKKEGSLPSSSLTRKKCIAFGETYREGAGTSKMLTLTDEERKNPKLVFDSVYKRVVCENGQWVTPKNSVKLTCKLSDGSDVGPGTESTKPLVFGFRPGLYTCINGEWQKDAKSCTFQGKKLTHGDIVQVSTTTKAVGANTPVATTTSMVCKNGAMSPK